ncbi:hypothetical protein SETIT_5G193300v2 [Setaria italica]|uniref:Uncharacterized protein n=2 Tax=Setaria TaxID=4554 RepID=A0A368R6G3_SETIT|nr:hypothetical protein SETIT_5G193300v2 [Setaria italica]TKW14867.1 hypothetical protein SEVIR_5G195600v2 [Setaria viridis]
MASSAPSLLMKAASPQQQCSLAVLACWSENPKSLCCSFLHRASCKATQQAAALQASHIGPHAGVQACGAVRPKRDTSTSRGRPCAGASGWDGGRPDKCLCPAALPSGGLQVSISSAAGDAKRRCGWRD